MRQASSPESSGTRYQQHFFKPAQTADEIRNEQLATVERLRVINADLDMRHEARRRAELILDRLAPVAPVSEGPEMLDRADPRFNVGSVEWRANRLKRARLSLVLFDRIYKRLTGRRSGAADPALVDVRWAA